MITIIMLIFQAEDSFEVLTLPLNRPANESYALKMNIIVILLPEEYFLTSE